MFAPMRKHFKAKKIALTAIIISLVYFLFVLVRGHRKLKFEIKFRVFIKVELTNNLL